MKFLTFPVFLLLVVAFSAKHKASIELSKVDSPKNIILLIGDGMGLAQVSGALYQTSLPFSLESFPVIGFQKTHSANNLVTDSAASATAMSSGKKTNNNVLGLDKNGVRCKSILEEAMERGYATGLVVTSSIQHATPAGFYAHQPARNLYEDITLDLLESNIDFFIGGGKQHFERREKDSRNVSDELRQKGYDVYDYFNNILETVEAKKDRRFAFFTADKEPLPAILGRDYLPLATKKAMNYLNQRSKKGFFLMVEGSQIDWACHSNKTDALYAEMDEFDKTIKQVLKFALKNGETLVIVTADHETGGFALNGGTRKLLAPQFTTNGHTAAMVPVFAYGPKSELFRGIYDNTAIYQKMHEAFGF